MVVSGQKNEEVLRFVKKQGMIRVRDAIAHGIHPEYLRRLCEKRPAGETEQGNIHPCR